MGIESNIVTMIVFKKTYYKFILLYLGKASLIK